MATGAAWTPLIDDWVTYKRALGGGLSEATATGYRGDLGFLARLLADDLGRDPTTEDSDVELWRRDASRVTTADLDADSVAFMVSSLVVLGQAPATRRRYLAALRGFCQYLVRAGELEDDPTGDIVAPRLPLSLPVALSEAEVVRVLAAAEDPSTSGREHWPVRDVAICRVLLGTGVRNAELCSMTVGAIDRDPRPMTIRVRGKGSKDRVIPIAAPVIARVDHYLEERPTRTGRQAQRTDPLFVRSTGETFDRFSLDRIVTRLFDQAAVSEHPQEKSHRFRHTYAKTLLEAGRPLNEVSALLGHTDLRATSIYLRTTAGEAAAAADAAPGSQLR